MLFISVFPPSIGPTSTNRTSSRDKTWVGQNGLCACQLEISAHLYSDEVSRFKVIGWTAAPVHYVLILTLTAQLPVPVGHTQVVVHQSLTHMAVSQHGVKERLRNRKNIPSDLLLCQQNKHGTDSDTEIIFVLNNLTEWSFKTLYCLCKLLLLCIRIHQMIWFDNNK